MPAKSKSQQRLFGMVHAYQKGELDNPSNEIKDIAKSISKKDAKDFAETKHKGLPNKVKKSVKETVTLNEAQLRKIVAESIKKVLKEDATSNVNNTAFMRQLDNKYYEKITGAIASYIEEYMRMAHPEVDRAVVDEKINLWANAWYSQLTRNLLSFENLPDNSFDSGSFAG